MRCAEVTWTYKVQDRLRGALCRPSRTLGALDDCVKAEHRCVQAGSFTAGKGSDDECFETKDDTDGRGGNGADSEHEGPTGQAKAALAAVPHNHPLSSCMASGPAVVAPGAGCNLQINAGDDFRGELNWSVSRQQPRRLRSALTSGAMERID